MTNKNKPTGRLTNLYTLVQAAYNHSTQPLATWLWNSHVTCVYQNALDLCERFGGNSDLAAAGALLHDFGDAWLERSDGAFENKTIVESTQALTHAGYSADEIHVILEEVIAPHSCYPGRLPTTQEGKVLATADAMAHLLTDFYEEARQRGLPSHSSNTFADWARGKIERDYSKKIFFEEIKKEVASRYAALRAMYNSVQ